MVATNEKQTNKQKGTGAKDCGPIKREQRELKGESARANKQIKQPI